jgi:ATP/maltotriose-dependent transcriptional regulator MalT
MASRAPLHAIETVATPLASRGRLVSTKLSPPRLRDNVVARPRLIEALDRTDASLVVVAAPAGYGKSIIVGHG